MRLRSKQTPAQTQRRRPQRGSPAVFSYYSRTGAAGSSNKQNVGRYISEEPVVKRLQLKLGHIPSYIALVAIVVGVLYSLSLQPDPRIHIVSKSGTVYRDSSVYQAEIAQLWKQSVLNRSKLTVNSKKLHEAIQSRFPELGEVRIELPLLGRRPAITVAPSSPAFELVSGNGTFYVAANGKVIGQTADLVKNELPGLLLVRDESGLSAESGKAVVPEPQAQFLVALDKQLKAANVSVQSITLPGDVANEADVRISGHAYYIKFSTEVDPRQAVEPPRQTTVQASSQSHLRPRRVGYGFS